jgi:hypothetical protein
MGAAGGSDAWHAAMGAAGGSDAWHAAMGAAGISGGGGGACDRWRSATSATYSAYSGVFNTVLFKFSGKIPRYSFN